MAKVPVLGGGGGLVPFRKEDFVVVNSDSRVDCQGRLRAIDLVEEGLSFGTNK
jgi:hypothetical protein